MELDCRDLSTRTDRVAAAVLAARRITVSGIDNNAQIAQSMDKRETAAAGVPLARRERRKARERRPAARLLGNQ